MCWVRKDTTQVNTGDFPPIHLEQNHGHQIIISPLRQDNTWSVNIDVDHFPQLRKHLAATTGLFNRVKFASEICDNRFLATKGGKYVLRFINAILGKQLHERLSIKTIHRSCIGKRSLVFKFLVVIAWCEVDV